MRSPTRTHWLFGGRPDAPANPTGLPLYSELVIYCPHPTIPNQFVEMTAPTNTQTVPAATDQAGWLAALATLKTNANTKSIVLTTLLCHLFHDRDGHAESSRRRPLRNPAAAFRHGLGQFSGGQRDLDELTLGSGDLRIDGRAAASVDAGGDAIDAWHDLDRIECGRRPAHAVLRIGRFVLPVEPSMRPMAEQRDCANDGRRRGMALLMVLLLLSLTLGLSYAAMRSQATVSMIQRNSDRRANARQDASPD